MKKSIIIVTTLMLIVGILFVGSKVYAESDKAIDNETESKLVEIKENASNSLEDYKEKYRFRHLWNSSLHIELSAYL